MNSTDKEILKHVIIYVVMIVVGIVPMVREITFISVGIFVLVGIFTVVVAARDMKRILSKIRCPNCENQISEFQSIAIRLKTKLKFCPFCGSEIVDSTVCASTDAET